MIGATGNACLPGERARSRPCGRGGHGKEVAGELCGLSCLPPSRLRAHNGPPMPRSTIVQEKGTILPSVDTAQRLPAECLRPFIARYGGFRISGPAFGPTRGLPSRHVTVMVGLGDPFRIAGVGSFTSFVAGLHDSANVAEIRGGVAGMHLVLKPLGTCSLLGAPAGVLAGRVFHLEDMVGACVHAELQDRLREAKTWSDRFDILDEVLARRLRWHDTTGELHWAWRKITADAGSTCIEDLAREIGWSRRHLSERFRVEIGVAPKALARIARFEQACALVRRAPGTIADIAAAAGYHDQSHMTREWRALAGCTPKTWITEEFPFVQDYELAALDNESC
jgi:AraC-like DNA-binding protein